MRNESSAMMSNGSLLPYVNSSPATTSSWSPGARPTADDVTRDGVALALDRTIRHSDEVERWIRDRYAAHGREMPVYAPSMARVIDGSRLLLNNRGAAPGMLFDLRGRLLAVLPGPPWEMAEMLERDLLPELVLWNPGAVRVRRTLVLGGVFESDVEESVRHLYERFGREDVSILASYGAVRLVLSAEGDEGSARDRLDVMERAFKEVLGDDLAGVDVTGLPEVAIVELRHRGQTLATAESCTGGLVSARLTDVPGASDAFVGGVVSYSNDVKEHQLGVPLEVLVEHGAVSEEVACAMASGVRHPARGRLGDRDHRDRRADRGHRGKTGGAGSLGGGRTRRRLGRAPGLSR